LGNTDLLEFNTSLHLYLLDQWLMLLGVEGNASTYFTSSGSST
jgi:hypothetical protein